MKGGRKSSVQALESSQFMRSAEKVLPSRAPTPQQGADLRETIGDLTEGEELPDLVDASL